MRRRTVLALIAGLGITAVIVAAVVVANTDVSRYRSLIAEAVSDATGRKLTLAGDLSLSLYPTPSLVVRDARLANAKWGSEPNMARIGTLAAKIHLMPLIRDGTLRIERLEMRDVSVLLETDKKGLGNWILDDKATEKAPEAEKAKSGDSDDTLPIDALISDIRLRRITLTYRDGRSGESATATLSRLRVRTTKGQTRVNGDAVVEGIPVAVKATLGSLAALTSAKKAFPISAEIAGLGATATVKGRARDPLAGRGLNFSVTAKGGDLNEVTSALGAAGAPALPWQLAARLRGDVDGTLTLQKLKARLGKSKATGGLKLQLAGTRPRFSGDLDFSVLDVPGLVPESHAPPAKDGRLIPPVALPADLSGGIDLDLNVKVARLETGDLPFENVAGRLRLGDRHLRLDPLKATYTGGAVNATIDYDGREDVPSATLWADGKGLDVGLILKRLSGEDIATAHGDLVFDVASTGATLRDLLAGLGGSASLIVGKGTLKSRETQLGGDLLMEFFSRLRGESETPLRCMVTLLDVAKGKASTRGMVLDTERVVVAGDGYVDLGKETIDLQLAPRPREVSLVNLATPINITGQLADPDVSVSKVGVAKNLAIGAASVFNPLVLLGKVVIDAASTAGGNPCLDAIKKLRAKPEPKPDPEIAPDGSELDGPQSDSGETGNPGEAIGNAVDNLGKTIEGIFK